MKKLFLAATTALMMVSLTTGAYAAKFKFPSDAPVAAVTIPDDWESGETESGVEATSPDEAVYLSIDVADAKSIDGVMDDAVNWLDEQGVTVDASTSKKTEDKLNGKDIIYVEWDGKDKDGPASIGLAALVLNADTILVLTYWGTKGEEEKNTATIGNILNSIKEQ